MKLKKQLVQERILYCLKHGGTKDRTIKATSRYTGISRYEVSQVFRELERRKKIQHRGHGWYK